MRAFGAARALLERLARPLVFRRRLPAAFGRSPMLVSSAGGLRYLRHGLGRVDPPLLAAVLHLVRPGDTVWDVGANLGLFTFAAAARAGRDGAVVAFEPDPALILLLRRSAGLQPATGAPVEVVPLAVGGAVALRRFALAERARASNALADYGRSEMGDRRSTVTVAAVPLDWCLERLPVPALVKIDVEGAEAEVLAGAPRLLSNARPSLLVEVGEDAAERVTACLRDARYRLFDAETPLERPRPVDCAVWATLAVPEERSASFAKTA